MNLYNIKVFKLNYMKKKTGTYLSTNKSKDENELQCINIFKVVFKAIDTI